MYKPTKFQHPDAQGPPSYATNKGGFVRGGIQVSQLAKQNDGHEKLEVKEYKEYTDTGHVPLDHKTYEYERKLQEAGERINNKSTEAIVKAASERMRRRRENLTRVAYDQDRRANDSYRRYGGAAFGSDEAKKGNWQHSDRYKADDGYVISSKTGFRFRPRDLDAKMEQNESKGWLHCWCQTLNFDKPVYELEIEGNTPQTMKVTASCVITTKFGETLDIRPTAVAGNKKAAMTEVAWKYIDELVRRGLVEPHLAPNRELSRCSQAGLTRDNLKGQIDLDFSDEAIEEGGGWTLKNCNMRLNAFCQQVKQPMEVQTDGFGPDHHRKTQASVKIQFHVYNEDEPRTY